MRTITTANGVLTIDIDKLTSDSVQMEIVHSHQPIVGISFDHDFALELAQALIKYVRKGRDGAASAASGRAI